jgi:hypothetical protein
MSKGYKPSYHLFKESKFVYTNPRIQEVHNSKRAANHVTILAVEQKECPPPPHTVERETQATALAVRKESKIIIICLCVSIS